jgi:hypothetical protein
LAAAPSPTATPRAADEVRRRAGSTVNASIANTVNIATIESLALVSSAKSA